MLLTYIMIGLAVAATVAIVRPDTMRDLQDRWGIGRVKAHACLALVAVATSASRHRRRVDPSAIESHLNH